MRSNLADDTFRAEVAATDLNRANTFVGEAIGLIHEVLPAGTILRRMSVDAVNALRVGERRVGGDSTVASSR